jgi:bifunctional ADP-heptose synthase (sugar kinase/adenylyltransferase)
MSKTLAYADLIATLDGLGNPEVAVVGDLILDHYVMGSVERISPEAPIPVLHVKSEQDRLGGAANVAANVISMGGQASLIGALGKDEPGERFNMLAEKRAACACCPPKSRAGPRCSKRAWFLKTSRCCASIAKTTHLLTRQVPPRL